MKGLMLKDLDCELSQFFLRSRAQSDNKVRGSRPLTRNRACLIMKERKEKTAPSLLDHRLKKKKKLKPPSTDTLEKAVGFMSFIYMANRHTVQSNLGKKEIFSCETQHS